MGATDVVQITLSRREIKSIVYALRDRATIPNLPRDLAEADRTLSHRLEGLLYQTEYADDIAAMLGEPSRKP